MIKHVSVIGAGTMGNGIAHVFAQSGFTVNLIDVNPTQLERALQTIGKNMDRQISKGSMTEEKKKEAKKQAEKSELDTYIISAKLLFAQLEKLRIDIIHP